MFTKFSSMLGDGDTLSMTITKKGDKLITSILPIKSDIKDDAKDRITPLVVSGTPDELNEGFADAVCAPMQKAAGILTNMQEFERSAAEAEKNSKAAKANADKAKKEAEERKKKYDKLIKKADELEKDKKILNAIACLKQAKEFATGNKSTVEGRIQKLEKMLNANSLFGEMDTEDPVKESYLDEADEQDNAASSEDTEEEINDNEEEE